MISSQTSRSGRAASARAIATRWRSPPESSPGKRSAMRGGQPHALEQPRRPRPRASRARRGRAASRAGPRDRVADAVARVERVVRVLEDDLDAPARLARAAASRARRERLAVEQDPARRRRVQARRRSARSSSCRSRTRRRARRTRPRRRRTRRRRPRRPCSWRLPCTAREPLDREERRRPSRRRPRERARGSSSSGGVRCHSKQRTRVAGADLLERRACSASQRATCCGQRGANAQPGGPLADADRDARDAASRRGAQVVGDRRDQAARVRVARAARARSAAGPSSTIRPGVHDGDPVGDLTATTARSCET